MAVILPRACTGCIVHRVPAGRADRSGLPSRGMAIDHRPALDHLSTNAPQTRHTVTAIIVSHDGARLLPGLVQALRAQTYPVEQTVAVDTGSRDRSGAVLAELIGQDAVFGMDRSTGYGEAVTVALRHATRRRSGMTDPSLARVEWIWLLHDDCEPAPDALDQLLRAASRDRTVVVLGPKVLDGQDRRTLREVGVSIDRAGRRVTGIDPGEIDQGQHDHKRAVLAVGSAGMLVRRDVWDRLAGSTRACGCSATTSTSAGGSRRPGRACRWSPTPCCTTTSSPRGGAGPSTAATPAGLTGRTRCTYSPSTFRCSPCSGWSAAASPGPWSAPPTSCSPSSLTRPRRTRSPCCGCSGTRSGCSRPAAAGPGPWRRGTPRSALFIQPARTLSKLAEKIAGLISNGPPQASGGRHQATAEESEEDEQFVDTQSVMRRIIGHPGVQLFTALLLVSLIAERRLLGTSPLGGGALVPAWGGAAALWQEYLAGFHAVERGLHRVRPAVPGGRGRARHRPRRPGVAGGGRAAARLRAAGRADRLPGQPLAGHRHPGPGAARGVVRAAARRHRRRRRGPPRHVGRVHPAAADRDSAPAGC